MRLQINGSKEETRGRHRPVQEVEDFDDEEGSDEVGRRSMKFQPCTVTELR